MSLQTARLHFNEQGTPVADTYDDVYYSNVSGLEESRFVFIRNNGLHERWCQHSGNDFCIAETGFGTGLNFLATWQAFDSFRQAKPDSSLTDLYFISVEKHPLRQQDLSKALAPWPQLESFSQHLVDQYPCITPGCHRLIFRADGYSITLDLWFGDLESVLPQMEHSDPGHIDAWYLDGFAPGKNPDMWTQSLFDAMAQLGRPDSTFATFTAAGFVRRGLIAAGFEVNKVPGFGRKREMLAGTLSERAARPHPQPWFIPQPAQGQRIAIIGAGLAGANLAYSLVRRGHQVDLYSTGLADGASGNAQGGFYPQLHAQANTTSLLMAQSFAFARQRYDQLLSAGHHFEHDFCGVLQLGFNDNSASRLKNLLAKGIWPSDLVEGIDVAQAEQLAGLPLPYEGIYFARGGWINPAGLIKALLDACGDRCQFHANSTLMSVQHCNTGWQMNFATGQPQMADSIVFATGAQSLSLPQLQNLPLRPVRGQVEAIPTQGALQQLKTVLCHKGYLTPAHHHRQALGSTYVKNDMSVTVRKSETQTNLEQQATALEQCQWAQNITSDGQARASIRLSTPDHLPLVGAVPDIIEQTRQYQSLNRYPQARHYAPARGFNNLYVLTGFGSRALCTAPLAAEALACQMHGSPLPLSREQIAALSPNRFLIRQLKRGQ